jgi:hypothetical protein
MFSILPEIAKNKYKMKYSVIYNLYSINNCRRFLKLCIRLPRGQKQDFILQGA